MKDIWKKGAAEGLGTFVLVFLGTGAIIINDQYNDVLTNLGIAIAFGAAVSIAIYTFGNVSGAHINPAVTLGFWTAKNMPSREVPWYVLFQFIGGLTASFMLYRLFPTHGSLGATQPSGAIWIAFVLEVFLTFALMLIIIFVSSDLRYKKLVGLIVGAVVMLEALFAGPVTGASMNPARSLSPALISGNTTNVWIYLTAPLIGALLSIFLWNRLKKN